MGRASPSYHGIANDAGRQSAIMLRAKHGTLLLPIACLVCVAANVISASCQLFLLLFLHLLSSLLVPRNDQHIEKDD